jgi:glycogen debranching enzyme
VEVNALWIRALDVATQYAPSADIRSVCHSVAGRARESFLRRYVRRDGAGLLDVVDGPDGDDAAIRPNQLLAASLPGSPLDRATVRRVVDLCQQALLTPLGLRSLAPNDPGYRPQHRGSPAERDHAYHQGTVWPWLLGPYADAAASLEESVEPLLRGIEGHLQDWGVGSISETADGAPPHGATGCPFQAWSVAEILRVRRGVLTPAHERRVAALATA